MTKFYLRTSEHKGALYRDGVGGISTLGEMLLNLGAFERIIFDSAFTAGNLEIKHSITFYPVNPDNEMFSLCFTKEGVGEYHRLKRSIEELSD